MSSSSSSFYYPALSYISDVIQGQQTVVEFSSPHDFTVGEYVSFRVSKPNGMVELNNLQAVVNAITMFSITVPIDSTNFTPFQSIMNPVAFPAICVPAGTANVPGSSPMQSNLQDSFDNKPYNPLA